VSDTPHDTPFPAGLLRWAGNKSGGARRLFDIESGRPSGPVLPTNLLARLERWSDEFSKTPSSAPRLILLVGGPGNGKTEAIESTIEWLDRSLGCDGSLLKQLSTEFATTAAPRVARARGMKSNGDGYSIDVVQDASLPSSLLPGRQPFQLLVDELASAMSAGESGAYLCCVNRGVLDDALVHAIDQGLGTERALLEAITRSVSLEPSAPSCWPLEGFPSIAVWPMDAESLLLPTEGEGSPVPARQLLERALNAASWPPLGSCQAGDACPFCTNRALLASQPHQASFLKVMRWYELATGKRWNFRDLFSIVSFLLTGVRNPVDKKFHGPCGWAAEQLELDGRSKELPPERHRSSAIYWLVSAGYQHALFHGWNVEVAPRLMQDLKDLGIFNKDHTLTGLYFFLKTPATPALPSSLLPLLNDLSARLDPALSDPDGELELSARTRIPARDLDARFSQSTKAGLAFLRRYKCLSTLEDLLLSRLAEADELLAEEPSRRKPAVASRVQRLVRDFASRMARRSICMRSAAVKDSAVLGQFQDVVDAREQAGDLLYEAASQVEALLNNGEYFEVPLNTTFGQPLPPETKRATLVVGKQKVREGDVAKPGRPRAPVPFLKVKSSEQQIALTYDLFKSVTEINQGMSPASLPKTVVALLDTTRARLSGPIVRNEDILDGAHFQIGRSTERIVRTRLRFVAKQERS
jgi:hypothetical protein